MPSARRKRSSMYQRPRGVVGVGARFHVAVVGHLHDGGHAAHGLVPERHDGVAPFDQPAPAEIPGRFGRPAARPLVAVAVGDGVGVAVDETGDLDKVIGRHHGPRSSPPVRGGSRRAPLRAGVAHAVMMTTWSTTRSPTRACSPIRRRPTPSCAGAARCTTETSTGARCSPSAGPPTSTASSPTPDGGRTRPGPASPSARPERATCSTTTRPSTPAGGRSPATGSVRPPSAGSRTTSAP